MSTIKILRQRAGYSQAIVAERLNVVRTTIANWETGRREPSIRQVIELCRVLGCTADELLGMAPLPEASISAKESDGNG